jgi:hypothetical protein
MHIHIIIINASYSQYIINNHISHGRNVEKAISINPKLTGILEGTTLQPTDHVLSDSVLKVGGSFPHFIYQQYGLPLLLVQSSVPPVVATFCLNTQSDSISTSLGHINVASSIVKLITTSVLYLYTHTSIIWTWDSSISTVRGYGPHGWGSIPSRGKVLLLFTMSKAHPASYPMGTGGCLPRGMVAGV